MSELLWPDPPVVADVLLKLALLKKPALELRFALLENPASELTLLAWDELASLELL